jgi:hypothetical protein
MPAYAAEKPELRRWDNTAIISLSMQLDGSVIDCEGAVIGQAGTSSISATYTLEKLEDGSYRYVDSWSDNERDMVLATEKDVSGCTGGTYRLSVSATVTKDGYAESVYDWLTKSL